MPYPHRGLPYLLHRNTSPHKGGDGGHIRPIVPFQKLSRTTLAHVNVYHEERKGCERQYNRGHAVAVPARYQYDEGHNAGNRHDGPKYGLGGGGGEEGSASMWERREEGEKGEGLD